MLCSSMHRRRSLAARGLNEEGKKKLTASFDAATRTEARGCANVVVVGLERTAATVAPRAPRAWSEAIAKSTKRRRRRRSEGGERMGKR